MTAGMNKPILSAGSCAGDEWSGGLARLMMENFDQRFEEYSSRNEEKAEDPKETGASNSGEGLDFLLDFWVQKYLVEYVGEGGSKIKFVTGREGSGKSYFLRRFSERAKGLGYVTVQFSAKDVWLNDFREIYFEILRQCDLEQCVRGCAREVIRRMGFDPDEIPEGQTFMDYLASQGQADGITKRELRQELKTMFLQNPLMDNNFALALSLMTGGILGHPMLEDANREILLGWLRGDRSIKLSLLRSLGLSPSRITKYNARYMLRSLSEVIRLGGFKGLLVAIDDLDILQSKMGSDTIRYTKLRREDTYESIRQLIDDIDSCRGMMFVFAFDRVLLDNENAGIKAYQALWMRIQNEIVSERFNRFIDIADLDSLAYQEYTPAYLVKMSEEFGGRTITEAEAKEILTASRQGGIGVPELVRRAAESAPDVEGDILAAVLQNDSRTNDSRGILPEETAGPRKGEGAVL